MKRSIEILNYIESYRADHGYAPTIREIAAGVGLASSSTVHGHLKRLEKTGLISRKEFSPRAIVKNGEG